MKHANEHSHRRRRLVQPTGGQTRQEGPSPAVHAPRVHGAVPRHPRRPGRAAGATAPAPEQSQRPPPAAPAPAAWRATARLRAEPLPAPLPAAVGAHSRARPLRPALPRRPAGRRLRPGSARGARVGERHRHRVPGSGRLGSGGNPAPRALLSAPDRGACACGSGSSPRSAPCSTARRRPGGATRPELVPSTWRLLPDLDAALQSAVLPYLSLIDRPGPAGDDLSAFMAESAPTPWRRRSTMGAFPWCSSMAWMTLLASPDAAAGAGDRPAGRGAGRRLPARPAGRRFGRQSVPRTRKTCSGPHR